MRSRLVSSLAILALIAFAPTLRAQGSTTAAPKKPAANTVTCTDGSSSKSGRGACSGHGGVKAATTSAATPAPAATVAPAKTPAKAPAAKSASADAAGATAQCKDGTYSRAKTHQGACSRHGGVATFLK